MKIFVCLIICGLYSYAVTAQNFKNLNYTSLDSLLTIYYNNSEYENAIAVAEMGRTKAKGTQDSIYARFTNNLGVVYDDLGEYDKVEALYEEAKNVYAKALGVNNATYAGALQSLADLYETLGQYEKAEPMYLEAQEIMAKTMGKKSSQYATLLNNFAILYQNAGRFDEAENLYLESKKIRGEVLGTEHEDYSVSLNNLALFYEGMERYELALPLYLESKNIKAKILGTNDPSYATILNNLAGLYESTGQYDLALPLYLESKKIRSEIFGVEHPAYSASLNNLASLYQNKGEYDKSIELCLESEKINAKIFGKEHPMYGRTLNNLALLYNRIKKYELSESLYLESAKIYANALGITHPAYSNSLNNRANLYRETKKYEQAWATLKEVVKICANEEQSEINEGWAANLLQWNYYSTQHIDELISALDCMYDILAADGSPNASTKQLILSDIVTGLLKKLREEHTGHEDKLRMLSESSDWAHKSLKLLSKNTALLGGDKKVQGNRAFEIAEQNKSVLLLDASRAERAYEMGDLPESLAKEEKDLHKNKEALQAQLIEKRPDNEKDSLMSLLNKANQSIESFKKKIEKEYPHYAKLKFQNINATVGDIQKLLNEQTALIEYVVSNTSVYIFYIDQKEFNWTEQILDNGELAKKIKILHTALSNYSAMQEKKSELYQQYTEPAHWFYKKLLEPILPKSHNIKELVIVTDGELGHLPFEAFLTKQAAQSQTPYNELHYLINDFSISYNYSATLWKENKEEATHQNNGQVLAMAASYEASSAAPKVERMPIYQNLRGTLNPLPAARQEVEILYNEFGGFLALDGNATERIFKEKASDYAIIHLAMHGLLDNKAPILSSLAFTEDGDSVENNFLQAYEISKMKLNADLVVLSACETGYGKFEKGNGIASLARAFMYAGASSLIVSLWQVNDHATAVVMKNLYENIAKGMSKSQALRQAKLDYIKYAEGIAAHPAFWSPFILIGDESAVQIRNKNMNWWWGGLLGLGLGIVVWLRRKK